MTLPGRAMKLDRSQGFAAWTVAEQVIHLHAAEAKLLSWAVYQLHIVPQPGTEPLGAT